MFKLPKLHLISNLKAEEEEFSRIYRIGSYVYAQTQQHAAKFSSLILKESGLLSLLPEKCSIHSKDWKVLSEGFGFNLEQGGTYSDGTLYVMDKNGKDLLIEVLEAADELESKLDRAYSTKSNKPLPDEPLTNLVTSPNSLKNIITACSAQGGVGFVTTHPLRLVSEDQGTISLRVLIEQPKEYFIDAAIPADYRDIKPVDPEAFAEELAALEIAKAEEAAGVVAVGEETLESTGEGSEAEAEESLTVDEARHAEEEAEAEENDDWMM